MQKTTTYAITIGIIFFAYTAVLTYNIPFFWEDLLFIEGSVQQPYSNLAKQTFKFGTDNVSHPGIPLTTILMRIFTTLSNINHFWFRIFKAIIYGITMMMLFIFLTQFKISRTTAAIITLTTGYSYTLFLTNLFIPRPEITGIAAKLAGLSVFFYTFFNQKKLRTTKFYLLLLFSFALFFIALKLVSPLYVIAPTLTAFILLCDYRRITKFVPLIILLFAIYFPINPSTLFNGNIGTYQLSTENPAYMLGLTKQPAFFSLNQLYYKTLPEILTPFGIVIIPFFILTHFIIKKIALSFKERAFVTFNLVDLMLSFSIMFATPDPATRYFVLFMVPLFSLLVFLGVKACNVFNQIKIKKVVIAIIVLCFCIIIVYNIALSVLYRFTWGGAFIGMDKMSTHIDNLPGDKVIFYYSESAAEDYSPIKVVDGEFVKKTNTTFIRKPSYNEEELKKLSKKGKDVYFVKRISASGHSEYPLINFDQHPEFKKQKTIIGANNILDKIFLKAVHTLTKTCAANKFHLYKYNL